MEENTAIPGAFIQICFGFICTTLPERGISSFLRIRNHLQRQRQRRLLVYARRKKRRQRLPRRAWAWERNQFWSESLLAGNFVDEWWKENFRLSRETFNYIVEIVRPEMERADTNMKTVIPVHTRVAVALWRLATGDTYNNYVD